MTGLDKIIEKISADSEQNCRSIIEEANARAAQIVAEAKKNAAEQADRIIEKARLEADRKNAAAKSSAETVTRTRYLETRNAIINDILSAAYEEIIRLDDKAYFDLLFRLCVKNVETGECMMYLSQADLDRLPQDFESRINGEVYEKAAVQISKTPRDIENGFVLDYGDFEVNCVLKSVFDESMDRLKDMLCASLFS